MKKLNFLKGALCLFAALSCNSAWADFTQQWTSAPTPWSETAETQYPSGISTCTKSAGVSDSNPHTIHKAEQQVVSFGEDVTILFKYSTGSHMLVIVGVDLVNEAGTVVYSDYHEGSTGTNHDNNTYRFTGVASGTYTLRYFVCDKKTGGYAHDLKLTNGNITVTGLFHAPESAVEQTAMTEKIDEANQIYATTGIGYPKSDAASRIMLKRMIDLANANLTSKILYDSLVSAIAAYKADSNILLPEDGKLYTFANYSLFNGGTYRYLHYTNGAALSTITEESSASVFLCHQISAGVYVFITEDGRFLTWMGGADGYLNNNVRLGYSDVYPATQGNLSDWNNITIRDHGTSDDYFGYVHMKGRRSSSAVSAFIIKGETGHWDHAGDSEYFGSNSPYYSSVWKITEAVDATITEAQTLAIAKITASTSLDGLNVSNRVCDYTFTIDGVKVYAKAQVLAAINAANSVNEINTIIQSASINLPKQNRYYRLKGISGNYIDAVNLHNSSNGQMGMKSEAACNYDGTVFYLDSENRLKNLATGTYIKDTRHIGANESQADKWTFAEYVKTNLKGYITLRSNTTTTAAQNLHDNDGNRADRCSSICGDRHAWKLEQVDMIFSSAYGESWITMNRATNASHAAILLNNAVDEVPIFNVMDYSATGAFWCFVGSKDNFKIYNYLSGSTLALTPAATPANGVQVKMVAAESAESWHLIEYDNGYAIAPVGNTSFGINSYTGQVGSQLKFFGVADSGTHWNFTVMDLTRSINLSVAVDGATGLNKLGVAELQLTINGTTSSTNITGSIDAKSIYLPIDAVFSISSYAYRGYTFNGFSSADGYVDMILPDEGLTIAASYTANNERTLYYTPTNGHPYRIPAIATAPNGNIFAISDYRPCGNDIGYGEVDIKCRISTDNGLTWGDEFFIANGNGGDSNVMETGYGDAAVVADREQNKLLVMMVCGRTVCRDGRWDKSKIGDKEATAVNRVARVYATYNEQTQQWDWTTPEEVTDDIYSLFLNGDTPTVTSMFIGSGKICQSRVVKKGDYYRLYCSMWTRDEGNRVIYSDDFGGTWHVLGSINDRPAPSGDEPKVEELPDGTVLLSSRKGAGRYFNLYKYTDNTYTAGAWGTVASSNDQTDGLSFGGNSTNGEVLLVKAKNTNGDEKKLMLQSVPTGSGRSNVSIFYKELDEEGKNYTPITFSQGWTMGLEVSQRGSAYSTMIEQADGRIAFLFEEEPGNYCIVYIPLTIEQITSNAYTTIKPEGPSVGIVEIESMSQIVSELYDLQGRKVLHPVKGHLYVQNGRKFIQH